MTYPSKVLIYCFGDAHPKNDVFDTMFESGIRQRNDYSLWTLNDWYKRIEDGEYLFPDRVYQMHPMSEIEERYGPDFLDRLQQEDCTVVVQDDLGLGEQQEFFVFPDDHPDIMDTWYSNTLSYMLTDAQRMGVQEVYFYRANLLTGAERTAELYGLRQNIEECRRKGMTVVCPWEDIWDVYLEEYPPTYLNVGYGSGKMYKQAFPAD